VGDSTIQVAEGDDEPTEIGTQAASPKALADAAAIGSFQSEPKPSYPTASERAVQSTAAAVLDKSDLARSRVFHLFGFFGSLACAPLAFIVVGDRTARIGYWIGVGIMAVVNAVLAWMCGKPERFKPRVVGVLWVAATVAIQAGIYYFGPYSAAVMILILGIVFVAIGSVRWSALAATTACIVCHLGMGVPILLGWTPDIGVFSSRANPRIDVIVAEVMIVVMFISAYKLGRWARHTATRALSELQSAMRIIGDREQALQEVVESAERQKRVNEGRWTNQQIGSFRLGLVLGRGAMGEVYEAQGPGGQPAAVKLLSARSTESVPILERFHREMVIAARLESPYIVKVLEVSAPDAHVPYIAMERLRGTDLASRLRAESRIAGDELVVLIDQVARGLEVARVAGVVHRDLKPHNLFHHDGAVWKILDFGVSKVMDSEGTLTGDGIVGTPQYMAPEQATGGLVTHVADVYALGAVAYRCLTGRSPFKGTDLPELIYQVVHTPPQRPSTLGRVSGALDDVLAVAMAKDPRKRFPSAVTFAQAFIAARRGKPQALVVPDHAWI
jgi:serine/threonine-protein kinase